MVTFRPNKTDLPAGFSEEAKVFHEMGLEPGDKFVDKNGRQVIVEEAPFSNKYYLQLLEDTMLERKTEEILHYIGFREGEHFEKQFVPDSSKRRIDFAFPTAKLAIEPHARYLWEHGNADEEEKESELNNRGWSVLWLDEDDLDDREEAEQQIKNWMSEVLDSIKVDELEDSVFYVEKPQGGNGTQFYNVKSDNSVIYEGRVIPEKIADIHEVIK